MVYVASKLLYRAVLAGTVVMVVAVGWFVLQVYPLGGSGRQVVVTVHAGDSIAIISSELHAQGVINSPLAFRLDSLFFGAPVVQPGTYRIAQNSSFATVKAIFGAPVVSVTPGLTLHEVAVEVASIAGSTFAHHFVLDATAAAATSPFQPQGSLEGLIGVGDYKISPNETPRSLVRRMTDAFQSEAASAGLTPSTSLDGLNAYQLVIAASIVEKEGYYARNMPDVARVIFNRLQRGGPLQMDATVLYALGMDGGTVTHVMLHTKTPYNTYLVSGLTPTPICAISSTALSAVLHAPAGPWLYFTVVDQSGTEAFATTFAQQLANEKLGAARGLG